MMAKNKNKSKIVAADTSESAQKPTLEKLKALNAKLLKEAEDHQQEIKRLRHQLVEVTEKVEAAEMRLLAAVKEMDEKTTELVELKEKVRYLLHAKETADSEPGRRRWIKWLYPAAAVFVGTTVVILSCRSTSSKN